MFEFDGNRNDPEQLLSILKRFTHRWCIIHEENPGVSEGRLDKVPLPLPLRQLYAFAGEALGGIFDSIFSHQDHLVPFEQLEIVDGKLVFVFENQAVWCCATETTGVDPPVFIREEGDKPWQLLCDSLAQFLVTFCLHECVFGSVVLASIEDPEDAVKKTGQPEIPLWTDAVYAWREPVSFSMLAGGKILRMGGWFATQYEEVAEQYPRLFNDARIQKDDPYEKVVRETWEFVELPEWVRRNWLENAIARNEAMASKFNDKADFYRRKLKSIDNEE
ncbi:MAG: hypothetical protein AAF456_09905 [Planctomycetota bacterium]